MSEQFNALCDYSSSSEEDNDTEIKTSTEPSSKVQEINNCDDYIPSPAKRICKEKDKSTSLPSVPSTIRNMFKNTENILNGAPTVNSYQHDQRVRTFPHTRGNWATSIFIKVPKDLEELWDVQSWLSAKLNELWKYKQKQHKSLSEFDLGKLHYEKEPHISLTKVGVALQYHWINSFTSSIKSAFLRMKRFYVSFGNVKVFLNESNTRVFIGLEASAEQLQEHVNLIDSILKEFGQPEFYKDPKFHASLIWCLPITDNALSNMEISKESATINLEKQLNECIEEINRDIKAAYQTGELEAAGFVVSNLTAKIGDKYFEFQLNSS